jgi:geranylgeranyl diphosphate synthase type II
MSAAALVKETLDRYGGMAREAIDRYLRPAGQRTELHELAADYPGRGGRSLRASLCIAAARAFGASAEDAMNSAVALELMHNAFLIHDDIEDSSEARRGRPTLHLLQGIPIAVNVGDALSVMSLRPLLDNRDRLGLRVTMQILEEAGRMAEESVQGQAMELAWRRDNALELREQDYLQMILKKTCWYTCIYPLRVGALIGMRKALAAERFVRFGFFLGAAFQIQDDLLNLVGDPVRYGKEIGGDIWEGKRTLMLLRLCEQAPTAERIELRRLLGRPRHARTIADVDWIRSRMDRYACLEYASAVAHGLAGSAAHEFALECADLPSSPDKDFLAALPTWVLTRA